jgi:hypothetical protein
MSLWQKKDRTKQGLAQIRIKNFGTITMPEKFTRTPSKLITMIREIDKICPEEGAPELQDLSYGQQTNGNSNSPIAEQVVLLYQLGIHGEGPNYRGLTFPIRLCL